MKPTHTTDRTLADVSGFEAVLLDEMKLVAVRFKQAVPINQKAEGIRSLLNDLTREAPRHSRPMHRYALVAPAMAELAPDLAELIKRPLQLALGQIDDAVECPLIDEQAAHIVETTLEGPFNTAQIARQAVRNRQTARECLDALDAYESSLKPLRRVLLREATQ